MSAKVSSKENAVAICYVSKYGQTRKIADTLCRCLQGLGCRVDLINASDKSAKINPDVDAVILAAPLYAQQYPSDFHRFVKENQPFIASRPMAFCGVSLTRASKTSQEQDEAMKLIKAFLNQYHLSARWVYSFAGALNYKEYNFFIRWLMKRISKKAGGPTDTSQNYEFTDWSEVSKLAAEVAQALAVDESASSAV